ncbi:conserved hypothetical protein [Candidatus Koribacter versatilis Ellin345]|uniref:GIY-YIG nuclease family protein n=1 Tax=Koribacter versatilis (strain Ellin345) TaxID=204669 RepID=Q1IV25_KORVE|nr:GIY-YIG nuclease family protein [Candidatus Koribacter versatilis]ABF39275.1 conserved hypothetical protein [Candidatus Koribacter versatilis Ellin345]
MNTRKAAIREFKERAVPRGIFAVRCKATGSVWVDSSPNLTAAKNGLWFMLRTGSHRDKQLQAEWKERSEEQFAFEVLEELDPDTPALAVDDELKAKKAAWIEELKAKAIQK